jgi:hypothetical protein
MKADHPIYKRAKQVELALMRSAFINLPKEEQEKLRSMIHLFDLEAADLLEQVNEKINSPDYPRALVDELVSHHGKEGAKIRLREMQDVLEQSKLTKKINHAWKEKFGIK